jgi:hypothetical protein
VADRLRFVVVMAVTVLVVGVCLEFLPSSPLRGTLRDDRVRLNGEVALRTEGAHAWVMTQPGDPSVPVRYDPCRVVEVVVNPAGAPPQAVPLVRSALARVDAVTGLDLAYAGASGARPHWDEDQLPVVDAGGTPPVLVSWATAAQVPALVGDVAGLAASVARADRRGRLTFVTGQVTLDSDEFATLATEPEGRARMRAVLLHELGHLVGLAHVADPGELMNDRLGVLDYGPGDLAGLARLGRGPCA